eukprot:TRINITY_DN5601_c0_g1_i3.p2 TRINITY_DN5601_c0_g1~~TRINITY_DN5601_c0_g1_i3.p2  ORF type:complete len:324 (-),score=69.24 TRINITY_DN5601_c0_g1_i3:1554-2525(-)
MMASGQAAGAAASIVAASGAASKVVRRARPQQPFLRVGVLQPPWLPAGSELPGKILRADGGEGLPPARAVAAELRAQLRRLRPPRTLAIEAVGRQAILKSFKAIAGAAAAREPLRFVPLAFEVAAPPPSESSARQPGAKKARPWTRGVRFHVARCSVPLSLQDTATAADDAAADLEEDWHVPAAAAASPRQPVGIPPMKVAARTDVRKLAQAVFTERRLRAPETPVVLETVCAAQQVGVLCQALCMAHQTFVFGGSSGRTSKQLDLLADASERFSCTAAVLSPPDDFMSYFSKEVGLVLGIEGAPRLLRVSVWPADPVPWNPE